MSRLLYLLALSVECKERLTSPYSTVSESMSTPFRCRGCLKAFKRDSDLTRHLRNTRKPRCSAVAQEDLNTNMDLPPIQEWGGDFFGNDYVEEDFPMTAAEAAAPRYRHDDPSNTTQVETRIDDTAIPVANALDPFDQHATPSATTTDAPTHHAIFSQPRESAAGYATSEDEDEDNIPMPELEDMSDSDDEGIDSDEESEVDDVSDAAAMAELVEKLRGLSHHSPSRKSAFSTSVLSPMLIVHYLWVL